MKTSCAVAEYCKGKQMEENMIAENFNNRLMDLGIHLSQHPFGYSVSAGKDYSCFARDGEIAIRLGSSLDAELIDGVQAIKAIENKGFGEVSIGEDSSVKDSLWYFLANLQEC